MFFPLHCTELKESAIYESPLIAYVENDNPVQKETLENIELHFKKQANLIDQINGDIFFKNTLKVLIQGLATDEAVQAEALLKARDSQINLLSGSDRLIKKLSFPSLKFKLKGFKTQDAMDDYIAADTYGSKGSPGVCFGLTVHNKADNDFELELFFNDAVVLDYRSIPDQNDLAASSDVMIPQVR